jgi:hypothetical protein
MDPIALAGIFATAYGLGLLPQTKHDELLAGLIGYGVGHMGHGDLEKQLRGQEDRHRAEMHGARTRELELVRMLNQSEETRRTQLQLSEALRNAAIASRKPTTPHRP